MKDTILVRIYDPAHNFIQMFTATPETFQERMLKAWNKLKADNRFPRTYILDKIV